MEHKIDQILKNQGIIIQMLSDWMESATHRGKKPDMRAMLSPLLGSPVLRANPEVSKMIDDLLTTMGGNNE